MTTGILFAVLGIVWTSINMPDYVTSGDPKFTSFYIENATQFNLGLCVFIGCFISALVMMITEYFTSSSFPVTRNIGTTCCKGLPLNILKA